MSNEWKEIRPGLYVRQNTPRRVRLTEEFVEKITDKSECTSFNLAMRQLVEKTQKPSE